MNFTHYIRKELIRLDLEPMEKSALLKTIADLAAGIPGVNPDTVFRALRERESIGSTGFSRGLAIPHCKLEGVSDFHVGFVTIPKGTEFDSLDGAKTRLVVFIFAPEARRNEHIHLLSTLSRYFNNTGAIDKIVSLRDPRQLLDHFQGNESKSDVPRPVRDFCRIQIYIQDEKHVESILEILAGVEEASISVLEANDPGRYLNALPLFASFWNPERNHSHKIVTAILDKRVGNEIIRQVQSLGNESDSDSGIMITLEDLLYKDGSLNL